ncbi:claudin-23-like [Stigmatopora nigra]
MPNRTQQWARLSLRTPGIFIFGLVMAPCGWVLNLTATVAPNWRTLEDVENTPPNEFIEQGIWDICRSITTSTSSTCGLEDTPYFDNEIIDIAQGLMVASLVVTIAGLAVAIPGVRCWKQSPNWVVAGLGGILIFISGVFTLIPISWYAHILEDLNSVTVGTVRVGYCIVLGFIGAIFEILGGFVMFIGICRCCGGKNRGEVRVEETGRSRYTSRPQSQPRRVDIPSLRRDRSPAPSSVPYIRDPLDDDVSFPRAKTDGARSITTSYSGRPYDADL